MRFHGIHWEFGMMLGQQRWYTIIGIQRNLMENMFDSVVSTAPADGLAPIGARPSAGTVMPKFGFHISYKGQTLEVLIWIINSVLKRSSTSSTPFEYQDYRHRVTISPSITCLQFLLYNPGYVSLISASPCFRFLSMSMSQRRIVYHGHVPFLATDSVSRGPLTNKFHLHFIFDILPQSLQPWHAKSPATRLFVQKLAQAANKENTKTLHHWPFIRESTSLCITGPLWWESTCLHHWHFVWRETTITDALVDSPHKGQ